MISSSTAPSHLGTTDICKRDLALQKDAENTMDRTREQNGNKKDIKKQKMTI